MDKTNELPFVSICTPTFNRRPFIQNMFQCFRNQDYPKNRIEWIIVDDGTDKIKDLIVASNIPQIRYFEVNEKMFLGAKRNYMHKFVRGSIIVYMDDDDYYPPERISHSVERLLSDPNVLCAGASEIYLYFKHGMNKMIQCGPYGPNHATAGTFAFKTKLLEQTKYEDGAALAEEKAFLKQYTIPFIQLDPLKSILVFSHEHNTFDKRKMFEQKQDPNYFKESNKTVETFIRHDYEQDIKKFFMEDIDLLLENYEPGKPEMKPDVLKQIKEIESNRATMIENHQKEHGPIMLQREGQEAVQLSNGQVVSIIEQQKQQLLELTKKNENSTRFTQLLQTKVKELNEQIKQSPNISNNKSEIEQLKQQIKILTQRNENIENELQTQKQYSNKVSNELKNLKKKNGKSK